jgi:hypothetical protein
MWDSRFSEPDEWKLDYLASVGPNATSGRLAMRGDGGGVTAGLDVRFDDLTLTSLGAAGTAYTTVFAPTLTVPTVAAWESNDRTVYPTAHAPTVTTPTVTADGTAGGTAATTALTVTSTTPTVSPQGGQAATGTTTAATPALTTPAATPSGQPDPYRGRYAFQNARFYRRNNGDGTYRLMLVPLEQGIPSGYADTTWEEASPAFRMPQDDEDLITLRMSSEWIAYGAQADVANLKAAITARLRWFHYTDPTGGEL